MVYFCHRVPLQIQNEKFETPKHYFTYKSFENTPVHALDLIPVVFELN